MSFIKKKKQAPVKKSSFSLKTVPQQDTEQLDVIEDKSEQHTQNEPTTNLLNWFDLETKCQKLVYDIVQPTIFRADNDRTEFVKLRTQLNDDVTKRLEEVEFYLFKKTKQGKSPTVFDEIQAQINGIKNSSTTGLEQVNVRVDEEVSKSSSYDLALQKASEVVQFVQRKQTTQEQSIQDRIQSIMDSQVKSMEVFENQIRDLSKRVTDASKDFSRILRESEQKKSAFSSLETQNSMLNARMDQISQDRSTLQRDLTNLELHKTDKVDFKQKFDELRSFSNRCYVEICLKENQIATVENFVEKYLPMRVMSQISDALEHVWGLEEPSSADNLRRLREFEQKTRKKFTRDLLKDDGQPTLIQKVEQMQKQYCKRVILTNQANRFVPQSLTGIGETVAEGDESDEESARAESSMSQTSSKTGQSKSHGESSAPKRQSAAKAARNSDYSMNLKDLGIGEPEKVGLSRKQQEDLQIAKELSSPHRRQVAQANQILTAIKSGAVSTVTMEGLNKMQPDPNSQDRIPRFDSKKRLNTAQVIVQQQQQPPLEAAADEIRDEMAEKLLSYEKTVFNAIKNNTMIIGNQTDGKIKALELKMENSVEGIRATLFEVLNDQTAPQVKESNGVERVLERLMFMENEISKLQLQNRYQTHVNVPQTLMPQINMDAPSSARNALTASTPNRRRGKFANPGAASMQLTHTCGLQATVSAANFTSRSLVRRDLKIN